VVLDLVDGWHDRGFREEFFEVFDGVVGDADGFNLAGCDELLHCLPCLCVFPVGNEIARAVGVLGEFLVVACVLGRYNVRCEFRNVGLRFLAG